MFFLGDYKDYFGLCWDMLDYLRLFRAIMDYYGLSEIIKDLGVRVYQGFGVYS